MITRLTLIASAACLAMIKTACAAVVLGSFAGTLFDGADTSGVFGVAGKDLTDAPITGTYSYDTSLLSPVAAGSTNTGTGSPGAVTVAVTIFGQQFTFTDDSSSSVMIDDSTGEFDLSLTNAVGDGYETLLLSFVPTVDQFNGTDLAQAFSISSSYSSLGSFVIADPVNQASGDFTLSTITQSIVTSTPVPEPWSIAVMLPAFAAVGFVRRRMGRT